MMRVCVCVCVCVCVHMCVCTRACARALILTVHLSNFKKEGMQGCIELSLKEEWLASHHLPQLGGFYYFGELTAARVLFSAVMLLFTH